MNGEIFSYKYATNLCNFVKQEVERPFRMNQLDIEDGLQQKFFRSPTLNPPRPEMMGPHDIVYIRMLIMKLRTKIANNGFLPKLMNGVSDCKMHSLVPIKSTTRRHIPISREDFLSLLRRCNYPNLPTQQVFLANDILAAQIYWDVLDFRKMKFANVAEFRGQMRCFDFLLASDGYAFTAHFTRPSYAAGVETRPQDIVPNAGDEVFFVDPGQKMSFTAMKGLGSADNPSPIIKLSTVEYYTMAGLNRTSKYRLDQKKLDADRFGAANSVQRIESEMPTIKTVNAASIAAYLAYNALHYQRLADFYDEKFNRWRMWNYSGKQKAASEARKLKKTIYCNANFYL